MMGPRVQPPGLGEGHQSQKRAPSTTTEAASPGTRWDPVIAAIHLVFVSIRQRFTGGRPRACGGPAIMIMHPVNSRVGIPVITGIGGVPGITGTEERRSRHSSPSKNNLPASLPPILATKTIARSTPSVQKPEPYLQADIFV